MLFSFWPRNLSYKYDYLLRFPIFDVLCEGVCGSGAQGKRPFVRVDHGGLLVAHLAYSSHLASVSIFRATLVCLVFTPRLVLLRLLAELLALATYLGVYEYPGKLYKVDESIYSFRNSMWQSVGRVKVGRWLRLPNVKIIWSQSQSQSRYRVDGGAASLFCPANRSTRKCTVIVTANHRTASLLAPQCFEVSKPRYVVQRQLQSYKSAI
jgi:hypothetical protein